ncbi:uncharacterized protein [Lolium perenne]|uniref:uncharacterized protein n=1 Tax=Lolium perenne TaxID=4522 RepID=UPI003A996FF0
MDAKLMDDAEQEAEEEQAAHAAFDGEMEHRREAAAAEDDSSDIDVSSDDPNEATPEEWATEQRMLVVSFEMLKKAEDAANEALRQRLQDDVEAHRALASAWVHNMFNSAFVRKRKHSSLDELSAKVKVLEAENESLRNFMKESSSKETEARKELSEKHAREQAELIDKLEKSQGRVISTIAKNKALEAEAEAIDKLIFPSLGFEWTKDSNLTRTEAYDEARMSIDALFEACRGIATALSLKKAKTTVIDTMTKLMRQVPEFIKDWQKSSARGAASLVLATCKAFFPSLNLAQVARGAPESSDMSALLVETEGYEELFVVRVDHSLRDNGSSYQQSEEEDSE